MTEPSISARAWSGIYYIPSYQATPQQHISIKSMSDYMQDAADHSARELGFAYGQLPENMAWLMVRQRIEMKKLPLWRSSIQVETWPADAERLFAYRDFIFRDEQNAILGAATTQWVMLDLARKRPIRIPASVLNLRLPDKARPLAPLEKPQAFPEADLRFSFTVRYADTDLMGHTNNAVYVGWIGESVPREILLNHQIRMVDLSFKAESKWGDTVIVETAQIGERSFLHRILREADQKEILIGASAWE